MGLFIQEKILNTEKYSKDIKAASLISIIYGACGIIFVPIALLASASSKKILMPNMADLHLFDVIWNLASNSLSLYWGWRLGKQTESRLKNLSNLTGLYILNFGLVIGTSFINLWQPIRFVYLLPALFFLIIGLRAEIIARKIDRLNGSIRYKKRLFGWTAVALLITLFFAAIGSLQKMSNSLITALDNHDSAAVIAAIRNGEDPNQKVMGWSSPDLMDTQFS